MIETLFTRPLPPKRRRRPREAQPSSRPELALARVTAVRAADPFTSSAEAERWLEEALEAEETIDALLEEGTEMLNRALHAQATASADPLLAELRHEQAAAARIGFGAGEDVAAGRFASAREVDPRGAGPSRRRQRAEELRPQERVAAVLGGRETVDACETLLLRARADLDAGRLREAALQLRAGLEALLVELRGAIADPGHETDMGRLAERLEEAQEAAEAALRPEGPSSVQERQIGQLLETCERVLRRRRVLRGG